MTDYFWPSSLIPARSAVTLRDLSSRFVSPFTGTARTYSRPGGELLTLRMDLPTLTADKAAALRGMLAKLRGGVHRVWCKDHGYVRRGVFPAVEMVSNGTFISGTTGWTTSNSTVTAADRRLRITLTATNGYAFQSVSCTSGVSYVCRAHTMNMTGSAGTGIYVDFGTPASLYAVGGGLATVSTTASTTSGPVVIATNAASSGDAFESDYVSAARCALIKGASQTSARLLIDALPTSTEGLLLEGDQVQIGEELLTVAAPLNSNGSGEGYLTLHRPPRTTPADNAPVIIHEPMGVFMLAESENGWENVPGQFTNASVTLLEAPR